jgi:hypothetical protein
VKYVAKISIWHQNVLLDTKNINFWLITKDKIRQALLSKFSILTESLYSETFIQEQRKQSFNTGEYQPRFGMHYDQQGWIRVKPGVDFLFIGSWVQFLTPNFFPPFWGQIVELLFHEFCVDHKGRFSSQKVGRSGTQLPLYTRNRPLV